MQTKTYRIGFRWLLISIFLFAVVAFLIGVGLNQSEAASRAEARQMAEESLRRAAMTCYATEGYYPPTLEYIHDRYGIAVDTNHFYVFYEIFAPNIMPDITVRER